MDEKESEDGAAKSLLLINAENFWPPKKVFWCSRLQRGRGSFRTE
jgi:hypothetical protein